MFIGLEFILLCRKLSRNPIGFFACETVKLKLHPDLSFLHGHHRWQQQPGTRVEGHSHQPGPFSICLQVQTLSSLPCAKMIFGRLVWKKVQKSMLKKNINELWVELPPFLLLFWWFVDTLDLGRNVFASTGKLKVDIVVRLQALLLCPELYLSQHRSRMCSCKWYKK